MTKKILIAEDDYYIRDVYKSSFSAGGYTVDTAENGEQVLELLKANLYDIILLDIMLPKVSGLELLNRCRAEDSPMKNVPIYMITNLDEKVFVQKALDQGANGYFVKADLTSEELVEKMNAALKIQNN